MAKYTTIFFSKFFLLFGTQIFAKFSNYQHITRENKLKLTAVAWSYFHSPDFASFAHLNKGTKLSMFAVWKGDQSPECSLPEGKQALILDSCKNLSLNLSIHFFMTGNVIQMWCTESIQFSFLITLSSKDFSWVVWEETVVHNYLRRCSYVESELISLQVTTQFFSDTLTNIYLS